MESTWCAVAERYWTTSSFVFQAGEHWTVLEPNGAGKSTLMSLLGAVVHPTRATVSVLGHRLGRVDMR